MEHLNILSTKQLDKRLIAEGRGGQISSLDPWDRQVNLITVCTTHVGHHAICPTVDFLGGLKVKVKSRCTQ